MTDTVGRQRGSRRRRVPLDRQVIMDAATLLAARGAPITFRALGSILDADPTAVYRHFRDKDELVLAVFDRMVTQMVEHIDRTAPWKEQIRQGAHLTWDVCEEYPSIGIESLGLSTGGPGELAAIDIMLEQFRRSGLDQSDAVRFYAVVSAYTLSVGGALATSRMKAAAAGEAYEGAWLGYLGRVDPHLYPMVASARPELVDLREREIMEAGLEVILDAAESRARERTTGDPRP